MNAAEQASISLGESPRLAHRMFSHGAGVDAQRHGQYGQSEDNQVARQIHHYPCAAGERYLGDDPAPVCDPGHYLKPLDFTARALGAAATGW